MNGLTLKHLRYFEALAKEEHFGRAADASAISQPALSMQIKELESLLGVKLIERSGRQVKLTGFGEEFAYRARAVLQSTDDLCDMARASQGPLGGHLRIGVIPTIAPYLLPKLIKTLNTRIPGLDIRPHETVTQKLISSVVEGHLDLAILALPISHNTLHEERLFNEEFMLVRHASDAGKPIPNAEMLRTMRLLLLEEGHCFRGQALSFCNLSTTLPRDLMEGSSLSTLVQMVGAGIGVTLVPEMAVALDTRLANVDVARLPKPRPSRTIGMIWRKTTPLADQFLELSRLVRSMAAADSNIAS